MRLSIVLGLLVLSGCPTEQDPANTQQAKDACVKECQARLAKKQDLSNGPCLSDDLSGGLIAPHYVCDVAHSPRQDVDNQTANQCKAYHDGRADHFIEVDPSCAFITAK